MKKVADFEVFILDKDDIEEEKGDIINLQESNISEWFNKMKILKVIPFLQSFLVGMLKRAEFIKVSGDIQGLGVKFSKIFRLVKEEEL